MKIAAIICEYNPLHNGHRYHIDETKRRGADAVIAIMSGPITQRGDFACVDKWERTRMALVQGIDAVFELPAYFACNSAEEFASAGAYIASELGADILSFGAESDFDVLCRVRDARLSDDFDIVLKRKISEGLSYPRASYSALCELSGVENLGSNDILGILYMTQLSKISSKTEPFSVKRVLGGHNSGEISDNFTSSTYIRENILNDLTQNAGVMPKETLDILRKWRETNEFQNLQSIEKAFFIKARTEGIPDSGDGFGKMLDRISRETTSLSELINKATSKAYTQSRVKRFIVRYMIGALNTEIKLPTYARLLGFRRGRVLQEIESKAKISVVKSWVDLERNISGRDSISEEIFRIDNNAESIYDAMLSGDKGAFGRNYTEPMVII